MSNFQGLDVEAIGWSPDNLTFAGRRCNQVVEGSQLSGHHRLLLVQDEYDRKTKYAPKQAISKA